jgi:hypothetical protein
MSSGIVAIPIAGKSSGTHSCHGIVASIATDRLRRLAAGAQKSSLHALAAGKADRPRSSRAISDHM